MKIIKGKIIINKEMLELPAEELADIIYRKLMQEEAKIIAETIFKVRKIKKDEVEE